MTTEPPVLSVPYFRDRSGGLVGFGIVQILLGALCALVVPLGLLGMMLPKPPGQEDFDEATVFGGILIYGVMAVVIIWLGIGSIKAQRWARTLTMLASWSTLLYGVLMLPVMIVAMLFVPMPAVNGQEISLAARMIGAVFAGGFVGVFFILLPGLMAWFYSRAEVRATCEARHPQRSWTDACPPTVLLLSLWQAFGGMSLVFLALSFHGTLPIFGQIVTGWFGGLVCVVLALAMGGCGWMLYRLKPVGWWLTLGVAFVYAISGLFNALWLDYGDLYRAMGYSDVKVEQMELVRNFMHGPIGMVAMSLITFLPLFILLAYIRRYFVKRG